ncbi:trigger factor-like isoform X2 [Ostrea edulis]|uniref:trigger factor-like isoform X2 n=1 Tax=Ostrea edulis TaxID=37623 RepID=UPI0024AEA76C|nr:trigger factor-like isoform X2 [Ostrea edulis]
MIIFRHLLVLELYLYAGVLIKSLLTSKIDENYTVYDEVTSFDTTLKILDEIRDKPCLPCFKKINNWKGLHSFSQYSTSDDQEICRQIKCSFQGRCLRFKDDGCYSWAITVILEKKKYVLFSKTDASSDKNTNLNITCYDTGTAHKQRRFALNRSHAKFKRHTGKDHSHRRTTNKFQSTSVVTESATKKTKKENTRQTNKRECKKKCSNIKVNTAIATSTEISTTVSKEFRHKTSISDKELTDKERSDDVSDSSNGDDDGGDSNDNDDDDVDRYNGNDDDDDDKATERGNKDNLDRKCRKNCKQCRRCSGNKNLNDCVNTGNQKKCPECTSIAGIGAGILYFVQFIKEYRRKRNKEPKPESNEGMINASYGHTRGTAILQTSNDSHQEEGIYSEVDDKPESVLFNITGSNCSTGRVLNDRKHSKLPDVPHKYDRDEEYLLPQNTKDLLLSDTHSHSLEKVKTSTSILREKLLLKDVNELNQETERDNILQDTFVADSGHDDYFVLQKADDMNLK